MAASWLPTSKLFFLAVSSLFISIVIIKVDMANALLLYGATSILSFFIIPSKSIFIAYLVFFGLYGIVKFLCEQLNNSVIRWIAKFAAFNISLFIVYFLSSLVLVDGISAKLPLEILWFIAQVVFILYDIMYSLFIGFYYERLDNAIKHILK
jgi:hypothetical protein